MLALALILGYHPVIILAFCMEVSVVVFQDLLGSRIFVGFYLLQLVLKISR